MKQPVIGCIGALVSEIVIDHLLHRDMPVRTVRIDVELAREIQLFEEERLNNKPNRSYLSALTGEIRGDPLQNRFRFD
ncbi:hypothetical protein D3C74_485170 [compost metagenome]